MANKNYSHISRAVVSYGRLEKRPATPVGEKLEDWNKWDRGKGKAGLIWGRKQIGEYDGNRREMVKQ